MLESIFRNIECESFIKYGTDGVAQNCRFSLLQSLVVVNYWYFYIRICRGKVNEFNDAIDSSSIDLPDEFLVSSKTLKFLALITTTVSLSADGRYESEIIKSPSSTLASCSAHGPSDFHSSTLSDKSTCANGIFRPPMQTCRE